MGKIKYIVMDVDGTLTDGKIYMSCDGEAMKAFSIKDGYGIHDIAIPAGITPIIITGRESNIVINRCKELGIKEIHQGISNKAKKLCSIVENISAVAYIGDDLNDLSCMKLVHDRGGIVGCPSDAVLKVREIADYVCDCSGGNGAVREFIEWIVEQTR